MNWITLIEWIDNPKRKSADTAFKEGSANWQVAIRFEAILGNRDYLNTTVRKLRRKTRRL